MADTALRHLLRRGCKQVSPRRGPARPQSLRPNVRHHSESPQQVTAVLRSARRSRRIEKLRRTGGAARTAWTDDSRESRVSLSELELASLELLGAGPSPRFFTRSRATVCPDAPFDRDPVPTPWRTVRMEVAQSCAGRRVDAYAQGDSARRSEVSHPHGQRGRTVYAHQGRAGYSSCLGRRGCDRP